MTVLKTIWDLFDLSLLFSQSGIRKHSGISAWLLAFAYTCGLVPHGKKIPFLCWLFDSSEKRHVWCMNLESTLAVLKNGLEYPMLWRFGVKTDRENEKQTKLDLAREMLSEVRQLNNARLWVAMDRWFLCKKFLLWLMAQGFDWVTKAKGNTILYRKIYDPVLHKEHYIKLNPKQLLKDVYPRIRALGKGSVLSIPNIYLKVPYETGAL
ncbi:hypothetical protein [Thermanaerosceptrum fracticalcis]|uniref:hypothetical protein n=1 Tax=Thermanaerosceptrum fracticalcis TaxID=1712410 RepID=UPI000ACB6801|nr:hypothetical protein [Thermanaerosceptrum fracticalcis]